MDLIVSKVDQEYIQAKMTYGRKDSMLFVDIQDVIISIKLETSLSESEKIYYLEYVNLLLKDINTNLFSPKKIEEREYRLEVRAIPSIVYYSKNNKLVEYLVQNPNEALFSLPFLNSLPEILDVLEKIGRVNPLFIYKNIEEIYSIKGYESLIEALAIYDPITFVGQMDNNSVIREIASKSKHPAIIEILKIKLNYGNTSNLYYFLNEIVKNDFNNSHEIDFMSSRLDYTKLLIRIALDSSAYAHGAVANYLKKQGRWVFEEFQDNGTSIFNDFTKEELLTLTILCIDYLEYYDIESIIKYLNKNKEEYIDSKVITSMSVKSLQLFYTKVNKADFVKKFYNLIDLETVSYIESKVNYAETDILSSQYAHWITTKFNLEKEKKEREIQKSREISSTFQLNKIQLSLLNWARNLNKVDTNFVSIVNSPIGAHFIHYLSEKHPQILFNNKEKIKNLKGYNKILNLIAFNAPNSIKKYLSNPENDIYKSLHAYKNDTINILFKIYDNYKFNTKAYTLLHKILTKEYSIEEAHAIGESQVDYLKALIDITIQKNPAGIHSVEEEQNQISLKMIREVNDNPSVNHPRLNTIRNLQAKEIYSLMILGKEEIFHFAFDQIYSAFVSKTQGQSISQILTSANYFKFRDFSNLLAVFNKFPEFFYRNTTRKEQEEFIEKLVHIDFNEVECIEEAAVVCEFINNCAHSEVQKMIQSRIKAEYVDAESRKDQLALAVYSLLASNIGKRAYENKEWFAAMETKFSKFTLSSIDINQLKNKAGKIVEVCYFYNDADGVSSYNSFVNTFKKMPNWMMQDLGSYLYISSVNGVDVDVFANKPQYEQLGQHTIKEYLTINTIEPTVIVHRGHSYHSQKTIDQMLGSPKFIFMGSCGGYYKISELLVRSPNAQILSTKQVGTMGVNDPVLQQLNEKFRNNLSIDWPNFWGEQQMKFGGNTHFKSYVPPHKNNGALFVNAFFKIVGL